MAASTPAAGSRGRNPALLVGLISLLVIALIGFVVLRDSGDGGDVGDDGAGVEVAGSETLAGDVGGEVETDSGVRVDVPSGAIPLNSAGEMGEISFSVEEIDDVDSLGIPMADVELPDGVTLGDTVYRFGPEGQTFDGPVTIEIPFPDGVDADELGGIAYLGLDADSGEWAWTPIPTTIDDDAEVLRAQTMHFSIFAPWEAAEAYRDWEREHGGWIEVTNLNTWGDFPSDFFGGESPHFNTTATTYGVCITGYTLDDPDMDIPWNVTDDWLITKLAHPGADFTLPSDGTNVQWLPAGSYDLLEVWYGGEINRGELFYMPRAGWASRPYGVITIEPGDTVSFSEEDTDVLGDGWVAGRPTQCVGTPMPALGTGDIQVTLNWPQTGVDLDLHIIDPDGEEIYYAHMTSASGGWLDWDNTYGGNQPENIYWATAPDGEYRVVLDYFGPADGPTANWSIRTVVDGDTENFSGTIGPDAEDIEVTTFDVD